MADFVSHHSEIHRHSHHLPQKNRSDFIKITPIYQYVIPVYYTSHPRALAPRIAASLSFNSDTRSLILPL